MYKYEPFEYLNPCKLCSLKSVTFAGISDLNIVHLPFLFKLLPVVVVTYPLQRSALWRSIYLVHCVLLWQTELIVFLKLKQHAYF